jgi:CHC2-type zinc finger protein
MVQPFWEEKTPFQLLFGADAAFARLSWSAIQSSVSGSSRIPLLGSAELSMAGIDFRAARTLVSMAEVLTLLGFEARSCSGPQLRGPCPLHGSATSSRVFSVNLAKNTFQCFKCGASGNHLDLWASATKKSVYEAALDLCQRLGRDIPWLVAEQRRGTRN